MKALSIMQPWAWLIATGLKDVENRSWYTSYRGEFLIHAGKRVDRDANEDVSAGAHPVSGWPLSMPSPYAPECGGIVGIAELVNCVDQSGSDWFVGPWGFVIRNARPLPFRPCRGALGFFTPEGI